MVPVEQSITTSQQERTSVGDEYLVACVDQISGATTNGIRAWVSRNSERAQKIGIIAAEHVCSEGSSEWMVPVEVSVLTTEDERADLTRKDTVVPKDDALAADDVVTSIGL